MIRALILALALAAAPPAAAQSSPLDAIAADYVRLSLEADTHDPGYVDAYYGPAALRDAAKAHPRSLADLAAEAARLHAAVGAIAPDALTKAEQARRNFLLGQLKAAQTRLAMIAGEQFAFADEAEGLFGYRPQLKPLGHYDTVLAKLAKKLPGRGPVLERLAAYTTERTVPADRLEPVIRAAIAECRKRTLAHIALPANEHFTLEFVEGRPWSGYNWYKGDAQSLIQVNTDVPVSFDHAVVLGCHEGYPGHHAYNARLEDRLAKGRGWIEYTVYPLYSPQSFIAEGSANAGVKLAFPGTTQRAFEDRVLAPIAGMPAHEAQRVGDPAVDSLVAELRGAQLTIMAQYLDGALDRDAAHALLARYGQSGSFDFADQYRSYIINYSLGEALVTRALEAGGADEALRWRRMEHILSEPLVPAELEAATSRVTAN